MTGCTNSRAGRPAPQYPWTFDPRGRDRVTPESVQREHAALYGLVASFHRPAMYEVVRLPPVFAFAVDGQ